MELLNYSGILNPLKSLSDQIVYHPVKYKVLFGSTANEELQATTDRLENVRVDNGLLKITAKKENYGGKNYTSGRVRTYQKLDFTYGRVDIRAKMPSKAGTWPALWMLGSNYASLDWPKCGEIDILEHAGNRLNQIQSTVHHPDNYGSGDSNVTHELSLIHI